MEAMCRALAQASARRFLVRSIVNHFHSTSAYRAKKPATAFSPSIAACRPRPAAAAALKKVAEEWPRPATVPFQPKVANSVELMGYIHEPVQFKQAPDGKFWAGTLITQGKDLTTCLWIPILFEDDMAHVANRHLKENDYVHITGRLSADLPPVSVNEDQASVQVIVQSINFVEGQPQRKEPLPAARVEKYEDPASVLWRGLLDNPKQWWDYRSSKRDGLVKPRHPDFKSKVDKQSLWVYDAPQWVQPELDGMEFDVPEVKIVREVKTLKGSKGDQSWKDLVENPEKWWDNRFNKINPRAPDFKHKDSGEALWLSGSPTWVLPKLPPPRTKSRADNQ